MWIPFVRATTLCECVPQRQVHYARSVKVIDVCVLYTLPPALAHFLSCPILEAVNSYIGSRRDESRLHCEHEECSRAHSQPRQWSVPAADRAQCLGQASIHPSKLYVPLLGGLARLVLVGIVWHNSGSASSSILAIMMLDSPQ